MTEGQLDEAMMRDIQLHEQVEIFYIVDGWVCRYSTDDGSSWQSFTGTTPIAALKECFKEIRNKRGRK